MSWYKGINVKIRPRMKWGLGYKQRSRCGDLCVLDMSVKAKHIVNV